MNLTEDEVRKILQIVDEMDFREVRLEIGDLKLRVLKAPAGETVTPHDTEMDEVRPATSAPPVRESGPDAPAAAAPASGHLVRAPFAGVVYLSPRPGAPPFVTAGETITADRTVCLLEIMKLFQSVPADIAGRVAAIVARDGAAVREGDPLFSIEPAA